MKYHNIEFVGKIFEIAFNGNKLLNDILIPHGQGLIRLLALKMN